jgi:hypothetical protein
MRVCALQFSAAGQRRENEKGFHIKLDLSTCWNVTWRRSLGLCDQQFRKKPAAATALRRGQLEFSADLVRLCCFGAATALWEPARDHRHSLVACLLRRLDGLQQLLVLLLVGSQPGLQVGQQRLRLCLRACGGGRR